MSVLEEVKNGRKTRRIDSHLTKRRPPWETRCHVNAKPIKQQDARAKPRTSSRTARNLTLIIETLYWTIRMKNYGTRSLRPGERGAEPGKIQETKEPREKACSRDDMWSTCFDSFLYANALGNDAIIRWLNSDRKLFVTEIKQYREITFLFQLSTTIRFSYAILCRSTFHCDRVSRIFLKFEFLLRFIYFFSLRSLFSVLSSYD